MIRIPANIQGKALFDFLVQNKSDLIAQKCAMPIKSDAFAYPTSLVKDGDSVKSEPITKADSGDGGVIRVKIAANAALWMDSQQDVLSPDSAKKSISERGPKSKGLIYHLADHGRSIKDQIGNVVDVYYEKIDIRKLGIDKDGQTWVIVMESDVSKEDDERIYNLYKAGRVKQHSIGLQYVKLLLAINDKDYKAEFANWEQHRKDLINGEQADDLGYFWWVQEIKLYENSAVLWGSSELTPTLGIEGQPSDEDTGKSDTIQKPGPLTSDEIKKAILLTNFI
jgi:hypothetical protein